MKLTDDDLIHKDEVAQIDGNYLARSLIAEVQSLRAELRELRAPLNTLAQNLAIGAALCRAFWLGGARRHQHWRPGCGRSAP